MAHGLRSDAKVDQACGLDAAEQVSGPTCELSSERVAEILQFPYRIQPITLGRTAPPPSFHRAVRRVGWRRWRCRRAGPMIFQEEIIDKRDVRILLVDEEAFAFAIDAGPGEVDWRRAGRDVAITPITAPPEVIDTCQSYLEVLGLRYGAFDFAVNVNRYVFLECNQNGEWGWLQRATGVPVAEAIANALTRSAQTAGLQS